MKRAIAMGLIFSFVALGGHRMQAAESVTLVDVPDDSVKNDHYVSNREPLAPSRLIKLPVGAVKPEGWVLEFLERQRDGLTGHLDEISAWLQKENNAWFAADGRGDWGWEEVPYWLKGYANIGYILEDQAMIDEAMVWLEAAIENQREDGNFGPIHRFEDDGSQDFWANMIMLFCLQSYYEYSGDERVLDLMTDYFKFQLTVPDEELLTHYWQHLRGGDNLFSIYWLYNHTGDEFLLELAEKMHRNTGNWKMDGTLPNWHNVNIAQSFAEPATYYLQSKDPSDIQAAYDNFKIIRDIYGHVPGGMFGADENAREGFDDPRQGVETCGMVEQMLSNETLLWVTGDPFWADHTEEVAFNTYPASMTEDFRALRYFVCPNMVISDSENHAPGIQNHGPFFAMNPLSHRCCQHNHSHGWPYYAENMWMATPDNGLAAMFYGANHVTAKIGDSGQAVAITSESQYPFEETVKLTLDLEQTTRFPFYLRIPAWCESAAVKINGQALAVDSAPEKYIRIERDWSDGDLVELSLPMHIWIEKWEENHDSVSVNYGPLTFSLKIGEEHQPVPSTETAVWDAKWRPDLNVEDWPAYEILPTTPWNYGLVLDENDPASSFEVVKGSWPEDNYPWSTDAAPVMLKARARRIPEWGIDRYGLCAELQDSPVLSDEPVEEITLIPMGAARLRISAFPVIGDGPEAIRWDEVKALLPYNPEASHCFHGDTVTAMNDQVEPENSGDHSIPRLTFWDHKGTSEWVQYTFEESKKVNGVSVYWFDDTGAGECRVPKSWQLLYRDGDAWKPVAATGSYGTTKDQFNKVQFNEIETDALRIEVDLQDNYSAGMLEWQVEFTD